MPRLRAVFIALTLALAATPTLAQTVKLGDLTIDQAWSRATPKGSQVGAGYLTVHNTGTVADRLLDGSSEAADAVQVHEMSMDNGVMKMRRLKDGLAIAPGATVQLKPGADHLMLLGLKRPLAQGDTLKVILVFERAGKTEVAFKVGGIGDQGPGGGAMGHGATSMGR